MSSATAALEPGPSGCCEAASHEHGPSLIGAERVRAGVGDDGVHSF
jgi:hypothetical protein